jgi:hypothetical protein
MADPAEFFCGRVFVGLRDISVSVAGQAKGSKNFFCDYHHPSENRRQRADGNVAPIFFLFLRRQEAIGTSQKRAREIRLNIQQEYYKKWTK